MILQLQESATRVPCTSLRREIGCLRGIGRILHPFGRQMPQDFRKGADDRVDGVQILKDVGLCSNKCKF